jgi:hypothetical protein
MSDIHFECNKCSQPIEVTQELAGQLLECPACKETIEVPSNLPRAIPPALPRVQPPAIGLIDKYTVVPFVAVIAQGKGSQDAAAQLQQLIDSYSRNGWEYVRLESVETHVEGNNGCFGLGAVAPRMEIYTMAIFKK